MDDKLFDIFSEETTVPKCVLDRIDETLDTLERTEDKKNALKLLKGLKEPKETHLGYALNGYCGNAVGKEKGEKLYYKLSKSNAVKTGLLRKVPC